MSVATRRMVFTPTFFCRGWNFSKHIADWPQRLARRVSWPSVPEAWCHELPPPQLLEGVEQFNRGEYFEQHETLEVLWRVETRPVRRLYQGILQIGVAFYHLQRHNYHGVVYMLTRGSAHLEPFAPACQRIDVASLIELAASTLRVVEQLGPTRLDEFPWEPKPSVLVTE